MKQVVCAVLLALISAAVRAEDVTVPGVGTVRGTTSTTPYTSRTVYEFKGIPYAESPSGDLRFREPVPKRPFTEIFDATQYGQGCPQPGRPSLKADVEDCLTLDIYTPTLNTSANLPVLIFIHGGAFFFGTSQLAKPAFLLEYDMVLVSIQYRLGSLGWLNLNIADVPGNMGLVDQWLAIQWVEKNIPSFGGNPKLITVSGNSAGAASTSLQILSARFTGNIHRAAPLSGSAVASWAAVDPDVTEKLSRDVAKVAGCSNTLPSGMLARCLKNLTAAVIVNATLTAGFIDGKAGGLGLPGLQPTIQRKANGVNPFIEQLPTTQLRIGNKVPRNIPMMISVCKHEGIFTFDFINSRFVRQNNHHLNSTYLKNDIITDLLKMFGTQDNGHVMTDAVRRQYFDEEDMGDFLKMIPSLVDFTGTMYITGPSEKQAELYSKYADTYLFNFEYRGNYSLYNPDLPTSIPGVRGAITHSDDTGYFFPRFTERFNEADAAVSKRMARAMFNFVKYGNPTPKHDLGAEFSFPKWPSFDAKLRPYLSVTGKGECGANVLADLRKRFTLARDEGFIPSDLNVNVNKLLRQYARRL